MSASLETIVLRNVMLVIRTLGVMKETLDEGFTTARDAGGIDPGFRQDCRHRPSFVTNRGVPHWFSRNRCYLQDLGLCPHGERG
jgi:hypothetical protein